MKTDEDIERERAAFAPVVGDTAAGWYAEACRLELGHGRELLVWACRVRELVRRMAQEMGALAAAARALLSACSRLDEGGGQRVRDAADQVEKALWWEKV